MKDLTHKLLDSFSFMVPYFSGNISHISENFTEMLRGLGPVTTKISWLQAIGRSAAK